MADATSPPACPPIPSATAIKFADVIAESSLPDRRRPIAERAASANTGWLMCLSLTLIAK